MNIFDIILLLFILIVGVVGGVRKGFIYQVVTLIAMIGGTYLAYRFTGIVTELLTPHLDISQGVLNIISFTIIFIAVYLILWLLSLILKKMVAVVLGSWVDKLLGIVFSTLKVVLVIGLLIMLWDSINQTFGFVAQSKMNSSHIYVWIKDFTDSVFPYLKAMILRAKAL